MNTRLVEYIESSFLSPLLKKADITDISYNGVSLFYMDNLVGRRKADIEIDNETAINFLRQIANLSERQFSFSVPNLSISSGRYRINALHSSIVRVGDEKAVSFDIRIASNEMRITNDGKFMPSKVHEFLLYALNNNKSIVIGGSVGSGKTELQKYLISSFKENTRAIIIDDIQELDYMKRDEKLDITCWQIQPNNPNASISELVRVALRSNPDWLIVAESRGKEMVDLLNSVMTGHPIITTIHTSSLKHMPNRIAGMIQSSGSTEPYVDILRDVYDHFDVFVYLTREFKKDGTIERYVSSLGVSENGQIKTIYERSKNSEKD